MRIAIPSIMDNYLIWNINSNVKETAEIAHNIATGGKKTLVLARQ